MKNTFFIGLIGILLLSAGATIEAQKDRQIVTRNSIEQLCGQLHEICEKIIMIQYALPALEQEMKNVQEEEQKILIVFMARGFNKDKFDNLVQSIAESLTAEKDHETVVKELAAQTQYTTVQDKLDGVVNLVQMSLETALKGSMLVETAQKLDKQAQEIIQQLMENGYTEAQVKEFIEKTKEKVAAQLNEKIEQLQKEIEAETASQTK